MDRNEYPVNNIKKNFEYPNTVYSGSYRSDRIR